jgi:hypothetical protein
MGEGVAWIDVAQDGEIFYQICDKLHCVYCKCMIKLYQCAFVGLLNKYINIPLTFQSLALSLRTARFNIQKNYMVLALHVLKCKAVQNQYLLHCNNTPNHTQT